MLSIPFIIALTVISLAAIALSLYAIRYARNTKRESRQYMGAHMRALEVLTDPDLTDPSEDDGPIARRKKMHLLAVVAVTPGAVDWLREKSRAHPGAAASVVTLAAVGGYVALIWPQHTPDSTMSMELPLPPPPIVSTTTVLAPAPSAGGSAQAAPTSVPVTSGASMTSTSATLVAGPTTSARPAVPSSSGRPAPTSARSVPVATPQSAPVPACALAIQTDAVKPCMLVK
jgi:hypothetical protein